MISRFVLLLIFFSASLNALEIDDESIDAYKVGLHLVLTVGQRIEDAPNNPLIEACRAEYERLGILGDSPFALEPRASAIVKELLEQVKADYRYGCYLKTLLESINAGNPLVINARANAFKLACIDLLILELEKKGMIFPTNYGNNAKFIEDFLIANADIAEENLKFIVPAIFLYYYFHSMEKGLKSIEDQF